MYGNTDHAIGDGKERKDVGPKQMAEGWKGKRYAAGCKRFRIKWQQNGERERRDCEVAKRLSLQQDALKGRVWSRYRQPTGGYPPRCTAQQSEAQHTAPTPVPVQQSEAKQ